MALVEAAAASHPWDAAALASTLDAPTTVAFVADSPGVVGHVVASQVADEGEIFTIAVHPDARRQGLARALLDAVEASWRAHCVVTGWLEVRVDNPGAIALYEATGWTRTGVRRGYYDDGTDAVVMQRTL
jgi:ribosomal-protein-alanine N-acetyltransferase